ncbi:MAG: hypothetical protein LQ347_004184 [Umbilicaria vellea]|nr:MAG: hypothetical protein LQ347_004184 [Umbilicaria vellea]
MTQGFTPVHRRNQPQYNDSPASSVHAPWTTARCNRLLRAIASRIALLRKNRYQNTDDSVPIVRGNQSRQAQRAGDCGQRLDAALLSKQEVGQHVKAASYRHDPDWLPNSGTRRKIRHTYSGRCIGQAAKQHGAKRQCIDLALPGDGALGISTYGEYAYTQDSSAFQQEVGDGQQFRGTEGRQMEGSSIEGHKKACRSYRNRDLATDTRESFSKLAKKISPSHWMLINGLYDGLHALLKATSRSKPSSSRGPRSLFATCLRRVPDYIAAEQEWHDQEDLDDDLDMSSVIYGDLESFGSSGVPGWKPLREVVRSHGVTLLGEAIKDGLVKQNISRGLILLCLQSSAFDEAQYLVECIIAVAGKLRKPSTASAKLFEVESSPALGTLDLFARKTGRFHVQFRHLATLLSGGCLPIEWISTPDFVTCWKRVIFSISREDDHAGDASHLLQTAMSLSYGGRKATASSRIHGLRSNLHVDGSTLVFESKKALKSTRKIVISPLEASTEPDSGPFHLQRPLNATVTGLLILLCTTIQKPSLAMSSSSKQPCNDSSTALRRLLIDTQQAYELTQLESISNQPTFSAERATLLLLADALVELLSSDYDTSIVHAKLAEINVLATIDIGLAVEVLYTPFLCAVVRDFERDSPDGAFKRLQCLVHQLVEISTTHDIEPVARKLYGRIAVNTALEFSEGTGQAKHLEWALDVEDSVDGHGSKLASRTPAKTPARVSNKSANGYRWEEGLCEWIARTPALLVRNAGFVDETCGESSSESDSAPAIPTSIWTSRDEPHATRPRWASGEPGHDSSHGPRNGAQSGARCAAHRLLGNNAGRGSRSGQVSKSGAQVLRKRVFQEVYIDDDEEDELSTPESSQEHSKMGRRSLHEITNPAVSNTRRRAGTKLSRSTADIAKHIASRPRLAAMTDEDESEDELGV